MVDMGFGLVKSLGRYGTNFDGKIHISDLEYFDLASISKRLADPDQHPSASLFIQHSSNSKSGISQLFVAELETERFVFPDFKDPPQPPQEYKKSFENIIASPPRKPIVYYVGPPLALDFNPLLSPGKLLELGEIPGVTTPYWHVGEKDSGTAFHYEDGAIRSCNITVAGFKLWILIDVSSNTKFEDFIKSLYPSAAKQPRCGQWVRHLNILISPEKLAEMDIRFDLVLAGPGDMVITSPGQYHAVLNLTACFAIAINFALPEDPLLSPSLVCSQCGLYELEHSAIQQLERQVSPRGARRVSSSSSDDAALETRSQQDGDREDITLEEHGREQISQLGDSPSVAASSSSLPPSSGLCSITSPSTTSPGLKRVASSQNISKRSKQRLSHPGEIRSLSTISEGLRVFESIRSRDTLKQFCDLVSTKRDLQLHKVFISVQKGAAQRLVAIEKLGNSCRTFRHLNQYLFAADIEKAKNGLHRINSETKKGILQASGLSESQFNYNLREGNKWRRICGPFDGILCFIPSDMLSEHWNMEIPQLRELHVLLQDHYTTALCAVGKAFQQSLSGRDAYFTWETTDLSEPLDKLSEGDRLSYIQPVPLLPEDRFDTAEFPDWPDPTAIPPMEEQCEYCSSRSCNCYHSTTEVKPRIVVSPGKRLALQAISEKPNVVVYKDTDLIGFLTGKLVPPGTLEDDRVFDSYKCQVDCRDESNEFKLLHHACHGHAVAQLRLKRVSGRFRLAVVARKDIYDGEEITILSQGRHKTCEQCEDGR
ncbi:hypothetical protein F5883DRAFT_697773 [Diaporthe sp. PMI_573]|nr:hypothetical protein F5883DRAFT_697773 [Diaporthaceae sp. PMI_573]